MTNYGRGRTNQTIHLKDKELKSFGACGQSAAASVGIEHAQIITCKSCLKRIAKEQGK
jgi:hypothetical protein